MFLHVEDSFSNPKKVHTFFHCSTCKHIKVLVFILVFTQIPSPITHYPFTSIEQSETIAPNPSISIEQSETLGMAEARKARAVPRMQKILESLKLEKEKKKSAAQRSLIDKTLYMCFREHKNGGSITFVIHAIEMSHVLLLSDSSNSETSDSNQVAYLSGMNLPSDVGCGVFGSKILIAGGYKSTSKRHLMLDEPGLCPSKGIYVFETDPTEDPKPNIKPRIFEKFLGSKIDPLLVELNGKLYALGTGLFEVYPDPTSKLTCFEVFDPNKGNWSSLPNPPVFDPNSDFYNRCPSLFSSLIAGTNIFISTPDTAVFRFNVAGRKKEWTKHSPLCSGKPFPFDGETLVVDNDGDGGFLVFAYSIFDTPSTISVYLMSYGYDSLIALETLELQHLGPFPPHFLSPQSYRFIHLEGRKVCLVLTRLRGPFDFEFPDEFEKMCVLVLTFEYALTKMKSGSYSITTQSLGTRILEYNTRRSEESPDTTFADVLGGFVL